jgi:hypothetical protein
MDIKSRETVRSLGATHPADGLIEYLRGASSNSLSSFSLKNAGEMAEVRRELRDVLERWLDGLAIQKFIRWQQGQPRKVGGNGSSATARSEPMPRDVTPLDPFFRSKSEALAILRERSPSQRKKWSELFKRHGCLVCEARESYGASGCCCRCYVRIKARLGEIETDLRYEAARG